MEIKNKQEFFEQLQAELSRIGIDDAGDIFADFEEHFSESAEQGLSEEETCRRLGDIKEIARNYLNLESSRINSIIARDIEHKRGVSLTKPGRGVPADLSLLNENSAANAAASDCVRSYTPEHFSEEIYPNAAPNAAPNANGADAPSSNAFSGSAGANTSGGYAEGAGGGYTGPFAQKGNKVYGFPGSEGAQSGANYSANADKSVADAFSDAGKSIADAAKITGQAIADAFGNNGVKGAVMDAGKSAAEAVRAAGQSAADAVKKAKEDYGKRRTSRRAHAESGVPRPSDEFRENVGGGRVGTIPNQQYEHVGSKEGGFKFVDLKGLKPNIDWTRFVVVLLLDLFLWDWLIPAIAAAGFGGLFGGAVRIVGEGFCVLFGSYTYCQFYFPSRVLLTICLFSLSAIVFGLGILFAKLFVRLVRFVVEMHVKAIYDL